LTELGVKLNEQDYADFRVIFAATFPVLDEEVLGFAMQSFAAI